MANKITWADKVALQEKPDVVAENKVTAADMNQIKTAVNETIDTMPRWDQIYPVGSIYLSVNATNPSVLFGGTWEQLKGKFLVGVDSSDTDFETSGKTGGEKTHTLTVDEMPSHTHDMNDAVYGNYKNRLGIRGDGGGSNGLIPSMMQTTGYSRYIPTNTGGGQAHNNMPPYLAVYMWKRIS